ncbi:MAG: GerMN domain-containing protein [Treponema sp.]|nr:GerMN domain-containing protein [Treponema sp.]
MASKKKNNGVGVACCLLVAIVIFIIFIVQRKTIAENLKDTQLFERLGIKTPKVIEDYEIPEKAQSEEELPLKEETFTIHIDNSNDNKTSSGVGTGSGAGKETGTGAGSGIDTGAATTNKSSESQNQIASNNSKTDSTAGMKNESSAGTKSDNKTGAGTDTGKKDNAKAEESSKPITAEIKYTELQLCFVDYGADGIVSRKMIKRSVQKNDAPLTTAIKLLLEGPDFTKNAEKDCLTLIPDNTRLISARVENGIAYLNFSEDFEFNSFGVDGYRSQLMQIVYTATAFSNVKGVQFLIEGQKKEYLGSEGQRIGEVLTRNSF